MNLLENFDRCKPELVPLGEEKAGIEITDKWVTIIQSGSRNNDSRK